MAERISIEQRCRDLLDIAADVGLVPPIKDRPTAGDLTEMANYLQEVLRLSKADAAEKVDTLRTGLSVMIAAVDRARCQDSLPGMLTGLDAACRNAADLLDDVGEA